MNEAPLDSEGGGAFVNLVKCASCIQLGREDGPRLYKGNHSFALERS